MLCTCRAMLSTNLVCVHVYHPNLMCVVGWDVVQHFESSIHGLGRTQA